MSVADQPCYTLINVPMDTEPLSEMQLRQELGKPVLSQFNHRLILSNYTARCIISGGKVNVPSARLTQL